MMDEVIGFGTVVKGSRLTKTVQLSNFGDVKAHFKWDEKVYKKHFTISPESGYIPPNSNLDLEVTFHPKQVDHDIRYNDVKCEIKGGDSLHLTLMGKSVEQDQNSTQDLQFETVVRKATHQTINIQNTDDREWIVNPTIATESSDCNGYFSAKQTITIAPKQTAPFDVVYTPLTMSRDSADEHKSHKGSIFFPLPNGTALLYRLDGTANDPLVEDQLIENVSSKKNTFIVIPVKNWLKTTQRFKVSWK